MATTPLTEKIAMYGEQQTATDQLYGSTVSMFGNLVAVGSPYENEQEGSVFLFEVDVVTGAYTQVAHLVAEDSVTYSNFGHAVSVYEKMVAVSAWADDFNNQTNIGSVYMFTNTTGQWSQVQKLVSTDGKGNDEFGTSIALYKNTLAVGAVSWNNWQGCFYIFQFDDNSQTWIQIDQLVSSDPISWYSIQS